MAYIRKLNRRKGTVYRAEIFFSDGSNKSKTFRTSEDARRWARSEEDVRQNQKDFGMTRVRITLDAYFDKWIRDYATYRHSAGWLLSDRSMYGKYIQPILGLRLLREIQPVDVQRIVNEMRKSGRSEAYANQVRQLLHKMFNEAVKTDRYVMYNPVSAIKPFRPAQKSVVILNGEEAQMLLRWADTQVLGLGIHLALGLGMREGEVCGLQWDAIDLQCRTLDVRRKWQKKVSVLEDFAKGKKIRSLGIYPDDLLTRIRNQRNRFPDAEFVVCRPDQSMVTPMQLIRLLRLGVKATGIRKVTFHGLRHTYASLYMQSGGDLYDLQKILGHEAISTTERYRHTDPDYLRKKCGVLDLYQGEKPAMTQANSAQTPPKAEKPVLKLVR